MYIYKYFIRSKILTTDDEFSEKISLTIASIIYDRTEKAIKITN